MLDVEGKFNPHKTLISSIIRPSFKNAQGLCFKKFQFTEETTVCSTTNIASKYLYIGSIDGYIYRVDKKVSCSLFSF